jgi:hypothetical protein
MKNFKFEKSFSSFELSHENTLKSTKERWRTALHDPAYLIIFGGLTILAIVIIIIN